MRRSAASPLVASLSNVGPVGWVLQGRVGAVGAGLIAITLFDRGAATVILSHTDRHPSQKRNAAKLKALPFQAIREIKMEEPMMTDAQRDGLKTLCQKADEPDKSGELLTQQGAQHFIDEMKEQIAEPK